MVKLSRDNREEYTNRVIQALEGRNRDLFRELFLELHPTDQVEIFTSLDLEFRRLIYNFLTPEEFAEIFQSLDLAEQQTYLVEIEHNYAVEIFNEMPNDDLADLLGELSDAKAETFLKDMSMEEAQEVKELLGYPEETAGGIMTTEFISVAKSDTVSDVMALLRKVGLDAETIYYVYVVDHYEKLVGVLSLRELIVSPLEQQIEEIMSTRVVSVSALADQEEVARIIKNYDFLAVPVVTLEGVLVGIVTVDDVLDVLEEEATEDIGEITASKGAVDLDISSFEAAKKRLPWLILLLFIGLITAGLIGRFEATLEEVTILAIFIPLIAGMAGNTGTQSLAVVVRGLALGKFDQPTIIRLIKREAGTGILIGLVCGTLVSIISQFFAAGNFIFGFIIGFSLFCTLIVATLAGAMIPLIINKLKIDPAVASGPFITTINDILGLSIYFSIATALLKYL